MRAPLMLTRTWLRQTAGGQYAGSRYASHSVRQFLYSSSLSSSCRQSHTSSLLGHARPFLRRPPPPIKGGRASLYLAAAALSPAAFIELSEREDDDDGKTGEQQMLEASRAELAEQAPMWVGSSTRVRRSIWRFFDSWIIEPIATGLRFLHLVFIFVPVIATVPMIWIGARSGERDGERWGTVWCYGFLVSSMERAGAAFIKVGRDHVFSVCDVLDLANNHVCITSLVNGQHHDPTSSQPSFAPSCRLFTATLPLIRWLLPSAPSPAPLRCRLIRSSTSLTRNRLVSVP